MADEPEDGAEAWCTQCGEAISYDAETEAWQHDDVEVDEDCENPRP